MCFLITSFHLFKGNLVIFPLILAIFFFFWLSRPFCSIAACLALGLYLAVWRVPLHEDLTSYVRRLSPSEVLHNEIYRLTDCFPSCSSGGYIKYIIFLVRKGGKGRGKWGRSRGYLTSFSYFGQANNLELYTRHLFAVVEKPHSMFKYLHLILR